MALAGVAQWIECQSLNQKAHWVDSQAGHMPGLWAWCPVGGVVRSNLSMYLSHIDISLPLFLPPFLSL